jgi:alpha-1,3-rhamnosyl/mannosyltransferase
VLSRGLAGDGIDGIGSYTQQLHRRLATYSSLDLKLFGFDGATVLSGGEPVNDVGPFRRQALGALFLGRSYQGFSALRRDGLDLVHATDHFVPRLRGTPVVATLMDAIPLSNPEWVSYRFKQLTNEFWRRSMHWADLILTISEYSRSEIARWFRIPIERIEVIPLGVDECWFRTPSATKVKRVRESHDLPENFFLFVGTLQPRKNVARLIQAHRSLPQVTRREFPLVIAGRSGWGCDDVVQTLQTGDSAELRWLRYLPEDDLVAVLSAATGFVLPSLCEGFGLPVIEAFAAGIPVVAANTTALPEVTKDAALLVDPLNIEAIGDAMRRLAEDQGLAEELRESGLARARKYTWERTAELTLAAYRKQL